MTPRSIVRLRTVLLVVIVLASLVTLVAGTWSAVAAAGVVR
jgi:hypothetical protein